MLHELNGHKLDNAFNIKKPCESDIVMIINNDSCLLQYINNEYSPLKYSDVKHCLKQDIIYLFSIDETNVFLASCDVVDNKPSGCEYYDLKTLRANANREICFISALSVQLARWYGQNRFCGVCGKRLKHDTKERMLYCEGCGHMVYPRINPAVIVGVINGDSILLSGYAGAGKARYALIAGYTEIGETAEQTVSREVMEETGLRVKNIRYYKSQPWPFSDTLLMGFFCELDGDDNITLDTNELSYAGFKRADEIEFLDDGISLTREMIRVFKDNGANVMSILNGSID